MVSFEIRGEPVPKQAMKPFFGKGKMHSYLPKRTRNALADIRAQVASQLREKYPSFVPLEGPLRADIVFRFHKPKSAKKGAIWAETRGDLDNLIKSLGDGLQGIVFTNDKQICEIRTMKIWNESPGIFVKIEGIK
jgi:Holliday junction resolvase RusA-like endonuclease